MIAVYAARYWKWIGLGLIVAALLAYGLRNDSLRAGYKNRLDTIRIAFEDMGEKKPSYDQILPAVNKLASERTRYKAERDQERAANEIMANSVRRQAAETEQAMQESAEAQARVVQLTKERDRWISKARAASTRIERMEAEKELAECVTALSELREAGF